MQGADAEASAAIWDAWPVDPGRFGEATTTARRAAGDALGETEIGREWSSRVDEAVHGLDAVDPSRMDAWMQAHAESPVPEVYEARLVAAWETHANAGSSCEWTDDVVHVDELSDEGGDFVHSMNDPEVSAFTF